MIDIFNEIVEGIQEIFPETCDMDFTTETQLEEIPDWDSMSSVNLQSYLEQAFNISIPQDILSDELTLGELVSFIQEPEKVAV